jgi:DNA ligase-associated metallophosphoesterase
MIATTAAARKNIAHKAPAHLHLAGATIVMDPAGALYWPDEKLLVIADLHFEKGSSYAARRVFLPPYDTAATLMKLQELVSFYEPKRIVALGDSFHDVNASSRLVAQDRARIRALQTGRDWIWITGNHDPIAPSGLDGDVVGELAIGAIRFRHEPREEADGAGEIAGHLHPVARVGGLRDIGLGGTVRRRCFVSDGRRCVLPAFGAYAGGLNLRDEAFGSLFKDTARFAHILGRSQVYRVSHKFCLPD